MCCATCEKWGTCNKVDFETDMLVRSCFRGNTLLLDVNVVDEYKKKHMSYVLCSLDIIMLKAYKVSEKEFRIKALLIKSQNGSKYVCKLLVLPVTFIPYTNKFALFIKGLDYSMSRSTFKDLFNIDVQDSAYQTSYWGFETAEYRELKKNVQGVGEKVISTHSSRGVFKKVGT